MLTPKKKKTSDDRNRDYKRCQSNRLRTHTHPEYRTTATATDSAVTYKDELGLPGPKNERYQNHMLYAVLVLSSRILCLLLPW